MQQTGGKGPQQMQISNSWIYAHCSLRVSFTCDPYQQLTMAEDMSRMEVLFTRAEAHFTLPRRMANDEGWFIPVNSEPVLNRQRQRTIGHSFIPIGHYRIDCHRVDEETIYEMDTVHFVNVQNKVEIEYSPTVRAQLRHGEIVHVYGTGEGNARVFDEVNNEVAPIAIAECGRKRVHVRVPYFGRPTDLSGWMTAGSWMVPVIFDYDRPYRALDWNFTMDKHGQTYLSRVSAKPSCLKNG